MAKQQIVDADDNFLYLQERDQLNPSNDIYRISALWVTNSRGDILIAQRSINKRLGPGKWGVAVAGTIEEGETYESNIYNEAKEEIGLAGVKFKKGPKHRIRSRTNFFCQWYSVVTDKKIEEFTPQPEEVENLKWVSEARLLKDVNNNPDKYIDDFASILALFVG